MDTLMAIATGVISLRPQGVCRNAIAAAVLAGQIYKSSASAVVPWASASQSQQNMKTTMMVMMAIFLAGTCVGCCVQWALRRVCRDKVRIGRPLPGIRPLPMAAPPPPAQVTATAAAKAASRAVAKAASAPKAKASMPKAKAQPRQTELQCPLCGAPMCIKRASRGGCFYGCTEYPVCRGSRRPGA